MSTLFLSTVFNRHGLPYGQGGQGRVSPPQLKGVFQDVFIRQRFQHQVLYFGAHMTPSGQVTFQQQWENLGLSPQAFIRRVLSMGKVMAENSKSKLVEVPEALLSGGYILKKDYAATDFLPLQVKPMFYRRGFEGRNDVGFQVAYFGDGFMLIKKMSGHPTTPSLGALFGQAWLKTVVQDLVFNPNQHLTVEKTLLQKQSLLNGSAENYIEDLRVLEQLPQAAYTQLAESVKAINQGRCRMDFFGVNNILVDRENKRLNPIDLFYFDSQDPDFRPDTSMSVLFALLGSGKQVSEGIPFPVFVPDTRLRQEGAQLYKKIAQRWFAACHQTGFPHHTLFENNVMAVLNYAINNPSFTAVLKNTAKYGFSFQVYENFPLKFAIQ